MARAARDAGFEVHVATAIGRDAEAIRSEGFILHAVPFARGRLSPVDILRTVAALRKVYRVVDPAIVHHVSLQPTLFGILASSGHKFAIVNAINGLGSAFTADTAKARSLRNAIGLLLRHGLTRQRAVGLVQNPDDRHVLASLGIHPDNLTLIAGSGVDADALLPLPEPHGPVTVGFVGRMLADKGVRTLMAAREILCVSQTPCEFLLAGTPDPANPTSISEEELRRWGSEPGVTFLGNVDDIETVWRRSHIAVLPSRREGLPKSLLEAAACGRPLIASDAPGCREVVLHEETGLLVPVDDPHQLAAAISRLAQSADERSRFGVAARRLVDERFSSQRIGSETVSLYERLLRA
jgi:glycosyltransferase involved in cell wall biosynthesis